MNLRKFIAISAVVWTASATYGQTATLTADTTAVSAGAVVTVTASAYYSVAPAAAGWSVTLPEGWTFVATSGSDAPQVGPDAGATGTLEWAYATVPANSARFVITVKASGKAGPVQLKPKLYLRVDGKQQDVEVAPLSLTVSQ